MTWSRGADAPHPRILVVCTANICRSPVAEQMIRMEFERRSLPASVASVGFLEDGREADHVMTRLAETRGIAVVGHQSRVASAEVVESADLVVTMERRHARNLVVLAPDAGYRVHTLLGLLEVGARLDPPAGDLDRFLREADEARGIGALIGDLGPDEISDPHGRAKRHYKRCLDQLQPATNDLVTMLTAS